MNKMANPENDYGLSREEQDEILMVVRDSLAEGMRNFRNSMEVLGANNTTLAEGISELTEEVSQLKDQTEKLGPLVRFVMLAATARFLDEATLEEKREQLLPEMAKALAEVFVPQGTMLPKLQAQMPPDKYENFQSFLAASRETTDKQEAGRQAHRAYKVLQDSGIKLTDLIA